MHERPQMKITGLDTALIEAIKQIILQHKPVEKIVLFGSRAHRANNKTSDVDLAIFSTDWDSTDINLVLDELEEHIFTPLQFDLLLYHALQNEALKKEIEGGITLYHAKQS